MTVVKQKTEQMSTVLIEYERPFDTGPSGGPGPWRMTGRVRINSGDWITLPIEAVELMARFCVVGS